MAAGAASRGPKNDRRRHQYVEFSWPIGLPLVRPLGRGLWEVRSSLTNGRISRVIFCVDRGEMFLLHGFVKKTQKTPQQDLELAVKRMKGQEQ